MESKNPFFKNDSNRVFGYQFILLGGIPGTVVNFRCICQAAIKASAPSILLAHNHPSGNNEPSDADIKITKKLTEAGQLLDITLLDHLILLPEGDTSLAD